LPIYAPSKTLSPEIQNDTPSFLSTGICYFIDRKRARSEGLLALTLWAQRAAR
jgi:hypothetical protein